MFFYLIRCSDLFQNERSIVAIFLETIKIYIYFLNFQFKIISLLFFSFINTSDVIIFEMERYHRKLNAKNFFIR